MKQLVNKKDRRIRLVGLEDVETSDGNEYYISFRLPSGCCMWPGRDWEIEDYIPFPTRKGESEQFREWLRATMEQKGYSAMGLSRCMGYSTRWFSNFLHGRSRIKEKDLPRLAKELGVDVETMRALRADCTDSGETPTLR